MKYLVSVLFFILSFNYLNAQNRNVNTSHTILKLQPKDLNILVPSIVYSNTEYGERYYIWLIAPPVEETYKLEEKFIQLTKQYLGRTPYYCCFLENGKIKRSEKPIEDNYKDRWITEYKMIYK